MNRRTILTAAAWLPVSYVVVGCTGLSKAANDANIIADGITAILPTIQKLTGLAGGAYNTVTQSIAAIKSAANVLASSTGAVAETAAQDVMAAVQAVAAAVANLKVPPWVSTVVSAALTVAPVLLPLIPLAPADNTGLTVVQARGILIAAAAK